MRIILTLVFILFGAAAWAHHEMTPLREAVIDGHSHDVGGATMWLLGACIAMIVALYAVHRAVFPRK